MSAATILCLVFLIMVVGLVGALIINRLDILANRLDWINTTLKEANKIRNEKL